MLRLDMYLIYMRCLRSVLMRNVLNVLIILTSIPLNEGRVFLYLIFF
jgi:hypothetical protein